MPTALRVTDPVGSHKTVIDYASDRMAALIEPDDVIQLELLRELRHGADYPMSRSSRVPLTRLDAEHAVDLCDRLPGPSALNCWRLGRRLIKW